MRFGPVPVAAAEGAILAHSVPVEGGRIRKGQLLQADDIARLAAAGLGEVVVARLEPGDMGEDAAAEVVAAALVPQPEAAGLTLTPAATGRVNVYARGPGVLRVDAAAIHAANRVDPMITIATLPDFSRTGERLMVATVKIISYGVPAASVEAAALAARGALRVAPVRLKTASLIITDIGSGPGKGEEATRARLAALGMELAEVRVVPHRVGLLAGALAEVTTDLALILTASATSDPRDVGPEAVRRAGGVVERFGMPVDPGNLLFLGRIGARPVIGLPGCARSPALNGADWVLERVVCGLWPSADDIAAMGVGGLLKDIPARGLMRERARR
ncbi:molybdenum cofactor cytidylyltransferase [Meinhardsimonia xiamenensis]|jgi:molybdenum cofactor cytidylyltransferase|uniref:Molybdenum cofactor cytidylyltransferase n=1 Tax=Meinhardsimonia xiamenensis TaxID=990712 RepID=A0A1G9F6K0_9RHOB|nr:molybdopterin-binding protein [Meinhardsimonia xiamenensis]PRX37968.1 molybdenum cofactor cytidylyltransferase [Meinhardsimonia xiamenensis]SDK84012.1 molybdenum cofactor cytidylyltransferase [Meinhardsimonia xiamenensis]